MPAYTTGMVERILRNYLDIRYTLEGRGQQLPDTYAVPFKGRSIEAQPLGQTEHGQPWPFMSYKRTKPTIDGKAKSRLIEELHCAVLDVENALCKMPDDDLELIYRYHILQTHTLDDLLAEREVSSRGSLQRRIHRAVQRLARHMEYGR